MGRTQEGRRKEVPALSGEAVTFDVAMDMAHAGEHVTRADREVWLVFDAGSQCLTLNNGQTHRIRWVPCEEDKLATDWRVMPQPEEFGARTMGAVLELVEVWRDRVKQLETVLAFHVKSAADAMLEERERCAKIAGDAVTSMPTNVSGYSVSTMLASITVASAWIAAKIRSGE